MLSHLVKSPKTLLLLFLAFSSVACQRKQMKQTINVLEERVVLLEAALKANQELLAEMAETQAGVKTTPLEFLPVGDATMPTNAPASAGSDLSPLEEVLTEATDTSSAESEDINPSEEVDSVENLEPMDSLAHEPEIQIGEGQSLPQIEAVLVPHVYKRSLNAYFNNKLDEARDGFKQIITEHSAHELAPNASYWLGEVAYKKYNFNQALILFEQVLNNYPTSSKAPGALLKIGKCQKRLGREEEATATFRRLISDYSETDAAEKARTLY